jgi:hypothetical protein
MIEAYERLVARLVSLELEVESLQAVVLAASRYRGAYRMGDRFDELEAFGRLEVALDELLALLEASRPA